MRSSAYFRSPSRHCRDARVYGHTTTAMRDIEYPPPIEYTPPPPSFSPPPLGPILTSTTRARTATGGGVRLFSFRGPYQYRLSGTCYFLEGHTHCDASPTPRAHQLRVGSTKRCAGRQRVGGGRACQAGRGAAGLLGQALRRRKGAVGWCRYVARRRMDGLFCLSGVVRYQWLTHALGDGRLGIDSCGSIMFAIVFTYRADV